MHLHRKAVPHTGKGGYNFRPYRHPRGIGTLRAACAPVDEDQPKLVHRRVRKLRIAGQYLDRCVERCWKSTRGQQWKTV